MAKVRTGNDSKKVYTIRKFYGVNEAEEGEAALKMGEAAVCRNFRITDGGALKKRGGTMPLVGLTSDTRAVETAREMTVQETGEANAVFTLYPAVAPLDDGTLSLDGEAVSGVDFSALGDYLGYYAEVEGRIGRLARVSAPGRKKTVSWVQVYDGSQGLFPYNRWCVAYDTLLWTGTRYVGTGARVVEMSTLAGGWCVPENPERPSAVFLTASTAPTVAQIEALYPAHGYLAYVTANRTTKRRSGWEGEIDYDTYEEATFTAAYHEMASEPALEGDEVKAMWSGWVDGHEVLCAVANGLLWEIHEENGLWRRLLLGEAPGERVGLFGFEGKLYLLCGDGTAGNPWAYKAWDGHTLLDVEPYVPLVATASPPAGGATLLENVNRLTNKRRVRFSTLSTETVPYTLPERDIGAVLRVTDTATGETITPSAVDTEAGVVAFAAPSIGQNAVEVLYTKGDGAAEEVMRMRRAEIYSGATDALVFLYGDGSAKCIYSGLDGDGRPTAAYFPDLGECLVGDANTPITAMLRDHSRLLCFKNDSAWSIDYGTQTLVDGNAVHAFSVIPVNRDVGCCADGGAVLCENRPWTVDGRSVVEWRATSTSGMVTQDPRNAVRVSQRVRQSIRELDLTKARLFYDKIEHEFYLTDGDGTTLVHSTEADSWYIYTGVNISALVNYKDQVFVGTKEGELRVLREDYRYDGESGPIDARWESGAMDFNEAFTRKYSASTWLSLAQEAGAALTVSMETDRKTEFGFKPVTLRRRTDTPETDRVRIKAKKFSHLKIGLASSEPAPATVLAVSIEVRGSGLVR